MSTFCVDLFGKFDRGHLRRLLPESSRAVDVQYSCLIADGNLGRLYIETRRPDVTILDDQDMHIVQLTEGDFGRGTGRKKSLKYFKYMISEGQFISGDHGEFHDISLVSHSLVMMDNERSLNVREVKQLLKKKSITLHNYPAYMGHLFDPCDNSFHGDEQNRIDGSLEAVSDSHALTGDQKMRIIKEAYSQSTRRSIISFFDRCGFINNGESPRRVMSRLFDDHRKSAYRIYHRYHAKCLIRYLKYLVAQGRRPVDEPQRRGPWWEVIRHYRQMAVEKSMDT